MKKSLFTEFKNNKLFREMLIFTFIFILFIIIADFEIKKYNSNGDDYEKYNKRDYESTTIIIPFEKDTNYTGKINLYSDSNNLKVQLLIDVDGEVITDEMITSNLYCEVVYFDYEAKSNVNLTINLVFYGDSNSYIIIEREKNSIDIINQILEDSMMSFVIMLIISIIFTVLFYIKEEFPTEIPPSMSYKTKYDRKKIISEFYELFNKYIMKDLPNYQDMKVIDKLDILRVKCNEYFNFLANNGVKFVINRGNTLEPGSGIKFDKQSDNIIYQDYIQLKVLAHTIIKMEDKTNFVKINLVYIIFGSFALTFGLWSISDLFVFLPFVIIFIVFLISKRLSKQDAVVLDARASIGSATISREELMWLAKAMAEAE